MGDQNDTVIVYCSSGGSSDELLSQLQDICSDFVKVVVLSTVVVSAEIKNLKAVIFTFAPPLDSLVSMRTAYPYAFIVVYFKALADNPHDRLTLFDAGTNMVTASPPDICAVLERAVLLCGKSNGDYACPFCNMSGLTVDELWFHCPAYHINSQQDKLPCPICKEIPNTPTQAHIHHHHKPSSEPEIPSGRKVPMYSFSLVVCRHPVSGDYLLCQEFANQGFWLPGGAVDYGEKLCHAAIREAKEEAGIDIELKGILAMEQSAHKKYSRQRVIFYAEPKNPAQPPKTIPDFESAGACWCTKEEIWKGLRLRGSEPLEWTRYLDAGGTIYPMAILRE